MLLIDLSFSDKIWLKLGISYAIEALRGDWVNLLSNFSTVDFTETCLSNCRYRCGISRDGSAGMIYTRPEKCRYGIPYHTIPLWALETVTFSHKYCDVNLVSLIAGPFNGPVLFCLLASVVVCNAAGGQAGRAGGRVADTPRRASTKAQ